MRRRILLILSCVSLVCGGQALAKDDGGGHVSGGPGLKVPVLTPCQPTGGDGAGGGHVSGMVWAAKCIAYF